MFSVKSAYRLTLSRKHQASVCSSSSAPNGNRAIWNLIWKANVPPKVRVFAWRVATDSLPTRKNKWRRTLEINDCCSICGTVAEDSFHAVVDCTKAKAIRRAMRKFWGLPSEASFTYSGSDWLQLLLGRVDETARSRILLLFWRVWHLRNDIIHHDGKATIAESVNFLRSITLDCQPA
jgi:hypothetical protein